MTLGSLFDGAGTFPFAAQICGIETLWSSEIEPFPLAVTAKRFPHVKQIGDVTKINGAEIDPVDIITFGSPCQDLSVAGQRKGLDGERSGLFMEAIRIIKEMRKKTNGVYPRFAVWENVPGAFSSNKGEDFRTVLEEICKVKDGATVIPRPANRGGRWSDAGEIVADEYSVAWRVLDAQFWGVPQRRRRIFLVGDFGGQRAGEILFEREGLSRDFAESRKAWKGITKSLAYRADAKGWDARGNGDGNTIGTVTGDHNNRITDYSTVVCYAIGNGQADQTYFHDVARALNCMHDQQAVLCVYAMDRATFNQGQNAQYKPKIDDSGIMHTLVAKGPNAVGICERTRFISRRITPTGCARLQGMPDWWCDDVPHSDSAEYKMWGNGIALPCALYVMEGLEGVGQNG